MCVWYVQQLLQVLLRFETFGVELSSVLDAVCGGFCALDESVGLGCEGLGHVMSAAKFDLQCGLMCSYRYHCRCKSKPGIGVRLGKPCISSTFTLVLRILNGISAEFENSRKYTIPG